MASTTRGHLLNPRERSPHMFKMVGYSLAIAVLGVVWFYIIRSVARMARRSTAVKRRATAVMQDRRAMSSLEFGSEFFPKDQAKTASRLHDILKKVLIVDASRIRPDDRLIEDLGLGQVDGLDPNWLECDIEESLGLNVKPSWPAIKTVRDLVTYVASHQSAGR